MKQFIYILVFITLLAPHAQGQTFAATLPIAGSEIKQPAMANFTDYSHSSRGKGKGIWIAGTALMGVGVVTFFAGAIYSINVGFEENNNPYGGSTPEQISEAHSANLIMIGGAAVFATGTAMLIGGLTAYRHSKHRYGLVAPKKNQIGVAYNF